MRPNWPFVVHTLLDNFITDDLVHDERRIVTDARQKESKNDMNYSRCLEESADRFRHVLTQTLLVHYFVLSLHVYTRILVHVQLEDDTVNADLNIVQRFADRCKMRSMSLVPVISSVAFKPASTSSRRRIVERPAFLISTVTLMYHHLLRSILL